MQKNDASPSVEQTFGGAVKELRVRLGWSQQTLAEKLTAAGLSMDTSGVSRMEKGTRALRLSEALMVADALDVDLARLIRPREVLDAVARLEDEERDLRDRYRGAVENLGYMLGLREDLARSVGVEDEAANKPAVLSAARLRAAVTVSECTVQSVVREGVYQYVSNGPSEVEVTKILEDAGGLDAFTENLTGIRLDRG